MPYQKVIIYLDCDDRFENDKTLNYLKLPHCKNGFNKLECILENDNIYWNNTFVVSYDDIKNYIVTNKTDSDYGCFFIEENKIKTIDESLDSSWNRPWHKEEIYFNNIRITNAWFCFEIYK